jgi:sugar-phosphate isomerases, RpiB/LacA/LacB family
MKIFVAADHNGFRMKEKVVEYLRGKNLDIVDLGDKELNPDDDFPIFARMASLEVLSSDDSDPRAILICGGGQGMAMAANRFKGIRAAVAWDSTEAKMTRNDNDSNVLCLPARVLEENDTLWKDIIDTWCETPFSAAPRYIRRNGQIDET